MNKLQLYIYKSLRSFKSVRNFNPEENVQRHIRDMRPALENLRYDYAEKYLFYLISYIDEGTFFTILRTIPDGPLDHLATTIYIPNGLIITREEMADIVRRATRMVSNPSVSAEEVNDLHELFSKEYPVESEAPAAVASEGRKYAVCRYGGDTGRRLEDFFADKLYQPAWLPYAGVLLVDSDLGVTSSATDVTDIPLAATVALLPPPAGDDGFTPHIYHHTFNRPFRVPLGGDVEVVWRRGGFEDKVQHFTVTAPDLQLSPMSKADSRKTITPATFFISNRLGKQTVDNAVITVNGVEICEARTFTLDELRNADVVVRATGFMPFHARLDLAATTQALIQLQEHRKIYRFELPVKSSELGAPIHFEIHTKRDLTESPVEGYVLLDDIREGSGRSNLLSYVGSARGLAYKWVAAACGGALLVGLVLGAVLFGRSKTAVATDSLPAIESVELPAAESKAPEAPVGKKRAETAKTDAPEADKAEPAPAPAAAPTAVSAAAVAYLDGNKAWTRDGMAKYPELAGLFDDMNNFRIDRIADHWGTVLAKSKTFGRVAHHANEGRKKKIFKPEGTYCRPDGDNSITVQSYLNRIDPAKK